MLMAPKGESEAGLHRNVRDSERAIPAEFADRVVVIRPRHRLPIGFIDRRWDKLAEGRRPPPAPRRRGAPRRTARADGSDRRASAGAVSLLLEAVEAVVTPSVSGLFDSRGQLHCPLAELQG